MDINFRHSQIRKHIECAYFIGAELESVRAGLKMDEIKIKDICTNINLVFWQ